MITMQLSSHLLYQNDSTLDTLILATVKPLMKAGCNSGETREHYELALFTTSKRFQPIRMQCLLPVKIDAIINKVVKSFTLMSLSFQ